ncbi:MAG: hypothetical protein ACOYNC_15800 [Bacteroidales bacterium]
MKNKKSKTDKKGGKKLIELAGVAMEHEFYLEASWILSSLFEQKLKKLLGKLENRVPGTGVTLEQTIKRVKFLHISAKYPSLTGHFSLRLIDDIRTWKNQRNEILKDMPDVHVSQARMERLATDGMKLSRDLAKAVKAFKSAEADS